MLRVEILEYNETTPTQGVTMLQTVDGRENVYVVDFDTMPETPINWQTKEEKPYAIALGEAILEGIITEPGKYGIVVDEYTTTNLSYNIFQVKE